MNIADDADRLYHGGHPLFSPDSMVHSKELGSVYWTRIREAYVYARFTDETLRETDGTFWELVVDVGHPSGFEQLAPEYVSLTQVYPVEIPVPVTTRTEWRREPTSTEPRTYYDTVSAKDMETLFPTKDPA